MFEKLFLETLFISNLAFHNLDSFPNVSTIKYFIGRKERRCGLGFPKNIVKRGGMKEQKFMVNVNWEGKVLINEGVP
jgi:hypothetical protein